MKAHNSYGPVKAGRHYKVLGNKNDWYKLSIDGKAYYVPLWVMENE